MLKQLAYARVKRWLSVVLTGCVLAASMPPTLSVSGARHPRRLARPHLQGSPGDADGNGVVDIEDARLVTRFLVGQAGIPLVRDDADATEDGEITIEDALAIAQRVSRRSRVVRVTPEYGVRQRAFAGSLVRIEVFERFFPFHVTGGTVRIQSSSTGYDLGDQPLVFERDGRSLYYHWDTSGLSPASDYSIHVSLSESDALVGHQGTGTPVSHEQTEPEAVISLESRPFEITHLAEHQDAHSPAPGMPLVFGRVFPQDAAHAPYLGPLGRGWVHNYDVRLEEFTDGRIAFLTATGFNRWFESNADGTYAAAPGDYGILTRDRDGAFQLMEKDGFIYRFRSDLRLDTMEDLQGNRITAVYDDDDQLVSVEHSSGQSFHLEYNEQGCISRLTDDAGRATNYSYDGDGTHLVNVIDAAGEVVTYTYSLGQGEASDHRLTSIAYPDGTRQSFTFDDEARIASMEAAWGADRRTFAYDQDGTTRIVDAVGAETVVEVNDRRQPVSVTDPDGGQTTTEYDPYGNPTAVTDPLGHTTRFAYDASGNVVARTDPLDETTHYAYDAELNKPTRVTDPLGHTAWSEYDEGGNLTRTIYPDGTTEAFGYDGRGNMVALTDTLGHVSELSYNNRGQVTSSWNALGDTTEFTYDVAGDLESVTDANGHAISIERDVPGRLTRRTYPDGTHEGLEYDEAGKVTAFTNRRGERITYSYDAAGRLEWVSYPSGRKLHYYYDPRDMLAWVNVVSDTTSLDTYYEHDLSGRLSCVKVPGETELESYDVSYAYDAAGQRSFLAYPDGYGVAYEYDSAGRLTRIADASDATLAAYEYDAAGRRTRRILGNGSYTTYTYDDMDRLTELVNYGTGDTIQSCFGYAYDAAGMVTSTTTSEGVHHYAYDDVYQLTTVEYPGGRVVDYAFDEMGNRTRVTDAGEVADYVTNQLDQYTQVGDEGLSYDANGNLVRRERDGEVITYSWDEDDRLMSVNRGGVQIGYAYDHQGRLVAKTVDGQKRRYIWDGYQLIAEVNEEGEVLKRYIYGPGINEVLVVDGAGTAYWAQQDGLGSVVGTTSDTGSVAATASYDVYGALRTGNLGPVPQRLAGMWWDEDAALYYVRARWYDPNLGRFLTPDPAYTPGKNGYTYSENNPSNLLDPLGLQEYPVHGTLYYFFRPSGGYWEAVKAVATGEYGPEWQAAWWGCVGIAVLGSIMLWGGHAISGATVLSGEVGASQLVPEISLGTHAVRMLAVSSASQRAVLTLVAVTTAAGSILPFARLAQGNLLDSPDARPGWVWLNSAGGWYWGGGACPTFVQLTPEQERLTTGLSSYETSGKPLFANISVPIDEALLRSDIPIFGVAGGTDFVSYRVEYGEGRDPTEWHLIESSTAPQPANDVGLAEMRLMQGDIDIRGNLATWNTGLKNWVHLPWHPPEDPTDLNGLYTIRLVVEGEDGRKVEDRVTAEVGRVIAQCLPGVAVSPDGQVTMRFPEQSLAHPFRVHTILPLSDVVEASPSIPEGWDLIGPVYRIREPGDRFIKDVTLSFDVGRSELTGIDASRVGIAHYDTDQQRWLWLPTTRSPDGDGTVFATPLRELPTPRAIYALAVDPDDEDRSTARTPGPTDLIPLEPVQPAVLVRDTFEEDMGGWAARDRWVGGTVARDRDATVDGSYALRVNNEFQGGNTSVTVLEGSFDVRDYPVMSFDYRVPHGVKADFYLLVNGRWYNLGFTDDPIDLRYSDVNIGTMGRIEGILSDGQWHTASVNLYDLLRQRTKHTQVDAIIMADWDVEGYMKLAFGDNPRGATYWIDNFKLAAGSEGPRLDALWVDTFEDASGTNLVGGPMGTFSNPGTETCQAVVVDDPAAGDVADNRVLKLDFDTSDAGAWGGYWTALMAGDAEAMQALSVAVFSPEGTPPMLVGLRHASSDAEAKVPIAPYVAGADESGWRTAVVPVSVFESRGLPDVALLDALFFTFEHAIGSGKGTLFVDDLRFQQAPTQGLVADFDRYPLGDINALGGGFHVLEEEAASLSAGHHEDRVGSDGEPVAATRISYGGNIGLDYGQGRFSYAAWKTELLGLDARGFESLVLKMRGEEGGERPNIYLDDGTVRRCLRADELPALTTTWQEIRLPLRRFTSQGVDLSNLETLEIVFEWEKMSGTIYVAEIRFAGITPAQVMPSEAQAGGGGPEAAERPAGERDEPVAPSGEEVSQPRLEAQTVASPANPPPEKAALAAGGLALLVVVAFLSIRIGRRRESSA